MKKLSILFFAAFALLSFTVLAQVANPHATIGNELAAPGSTKDVPVTVDFNIGDGVGSLTWYITYNPAIATFVPGAWNAHASVPGITANSAGTGLIQVTWARGSNLPTKLVGKLFDLRFNYINGNTGLVFVHDLLSPSTTGYYALGTFDPDGQENQIVREGSSYFTNGSLGPVVEYSVPLSNWAIFIGLGLIVAFLVVRFRKLV